jgi:hypothetical protein
MVARFCQVAADPAQILYKLAIHDKLSLIVLAEDKNGICIQSSLPNKPKMLMEDKFPLRWRRRFLMEVSHFAIQRMDGTFDVILNGLLHNAKAT